MGLTCVGWLEDGGSDWWASMQAGGWISGQVGKRGVWMSEWAGGWEYGWVVGTDGRMLIVGPGAAWNGGKSERAGNRECQWGSRLAKDGCF